MPDTSVTSNKMATTSTLKDIDEKFCLCSICLEQLKEPKQLPCLHRYCKDCLRPIIQANNDVIKCPECREEIQIPTNGVDGFKTDFYSKSLVEYVQIQRSLKNDEIRECFSCSKHLRVAAFCFKCNDFLCKDCHNFHVRNKTLKDHQKHTLSLGDIEEKQITIEKLASMRDAPRCNTHPEKISELYCETCSNLPVCIACMLGEHKGHNLHEVKALAKLKREELANKLKTLKQMEKESKVTSLTHGKEKLMANVNTEKETVMKMHDEKDQKIMTEIQDIEGRIREVKREKQNSEKDIFESLQKDMEHEIKGIKNKYDEIFKLKKIEITDQFHHRERSLEKKLGKLREKRERFHQDKKELLESIEKQLNKNVKIIATMSEHFDNVKRRFDTLNEMASSILVSENDWSAVQYIPDICTAATNLMKELQKEFPKLTTLTDVTVNCRQYFFEKPGISKISNQFKKTFTINDPYLYVDGMTSSGDGNIVISGVTSDGAPFIIVVDINGRIVQEKKLNTWNTWTGSYCKYLSQHKVASVCEPYEIGLFDVRDGSYVKKNIRDVIKSWPEDRHVRCVATDPANNHILVVGWNSRDVHVFDDQLNYLHILTLPEMIKRSDDMTVGDGHLVVCDYGGGKCYVTSMDGSKSKVVGEFMGPDLAGNNCGPVSVCTNENGFVYVLWKRYGPEVQCKLVEYNQDGSHVLTTRKMDGDAQAITIVETSQGDKLLVATFRTQRVFLYDVRSEG